MSNFWNLPTNNIKGFTIYGSQPNILTAKWVNNNWPPSGTKFIPAEQQNINNGLQVKMRKKCYDSMQNYVVKHLDMNNVPMMNRTESSYSKYSPVK